MAERTQRSWSLFRGSPPALLLIVLPLGVGAASFEQDVEPILASRCVMCHLPGAAQGNHVLHPDAWENIVNVQATQSSMALVEPGKPTASYFYLKLVDQHLQAGGTGDLMPPFPQPPLDEDQIETVREWIEQGAQRN